MSFKGKLVRVIVVGRAKEDYAELNRTIRSMTKSSGIGRDSALLFSLSSVIFSESL